MPLASSLSQVSGATACRRAEETPGEGEKEERNQLHVGRKHAFDGLRFGRRRINCVKLKSSCCRLLLWVISLVGEPSVYCLCGGRYSYTGRLPPVTHTARRDNTHSHEGPHFCFHWNRPLRRAEEPSDESNDTDSFRGPEKTKDGERTEERADTQLKRSSLKHFRSPWTSFT